MNSSVPTSLNLRANEILFSDGTSIVTAKQNFYDTRFRKRVRADGDSQFMKNVTIEGNLTIGGSIISSDTGEIATSYVDNQTGWGLSEWSIAGSNYNKETDSLIVKIYYIENNYATKSYVDSSIQNTSAKYLVAYDANTYPQWSNPSSNYVNPVTTLAGNTDFIIRSSGSVVQNLRIQTSDTSVGKFLVCADTDGRVKWQEFTGTITTATTINSNMGLTDTATFTSYDSTNGRYIKMILNTSSQTIVNPAILENAVVLLLGQDVDLTPLCIVGVNSYTTECLQFKATSNLSNPLGYTKLSGGSTIDDQFVVLGQSGILIQPKLNEGIKVALPYVPYNSGTNRFTKPFSITGVNQIADYFPTFIVSKQNQTGQTNSLMINPRCGNGHYSHLCSTNDLQIIFSDTTQYTGDGATDEFPIQSSSLIFAPWSNWAEGLEMRSSVESEESVLNSSVSGFTRISGSTFYDAVSNNERVPWTYVMCDRNGITFKCSPARNDRPATSVTTYGHSRILNRQGPVLNDLSTGSFNSSFTVGEQSSWVSSFFYGTMYVNGDIRYNVGSRNVGDVLTCTDSSTGKVEWRPAAVVYPSTVSGDIIFLDDVTMNSNFQVTNVMQTKSIDGSGSISNHAADVYVDYQEIDTSTTPGGSGKLKNFDPDIVYFSKMNFFKHVGELYVPANCSNRIQFNIPFQLTHQWCFRGNRVDQYNNAVEFFYYVEGIEIQIKYNGVVEYEFDYDNYVYHSSKDLGFFKVRYDRDKSPEGPNDDTKKMTQQITISNPSFQFIPNSSTTSKLYEVYVRFYWSFHYNYYGESENKIASHYGSDITEHYFDDWWVVLNQSFSYSWSSSSYDYSGNTTTTRHDEQYIQKRWEHSNQEGSGTGLLWGTWYGNLPWGQSSLLNNDKINTSTKLLCGVGQFDTLLINGNTQSTGYLQCRGIMGRAGIGETNSNANLTYADMPSSNNLSTNSLFNFSWTGVAIETFVDYTKILIQSPNVSDYRIKSNFKSVSSVLDSICMTPVYQFDIDYELYKVTNKIGLIAHELQNNFPAYPNLVHGAKDAVHDGKIVAQSIDYNELVVILVKAIQELRQENIELRNEIQLIKSKLT